MKEQNLEQMLHELTRATKESVDPGLADSIKEKIPSDLSHHKHGIDTVNIIIDLRINKLAAAAAIIIALILLANVFKERSAGNGSIYTDGKQVVKYLLREINNQDASIARSRYEYLVEKGRDVSYFGDSVERGDSNSILMQWKINDNQYGVMFGDLSTKTVDAEQLIKLQAKMLSKKKK